MSGPVLYRDLEAGLYDLAALEKEHPGCYIQVSKEYEYGYGGSVSDYISVTLRWFDNPEEAK